MSSVTKRNLILAIILTVLSAAAVVFMSMYIKVQGNTLQTLIAALNEQGKQEASLIRLKKIEDSTVADREQLEDYFLEQRNGSIDFLNLIEQLAPERGINLVVESVSEVTEGRNENPEWIEVSLSLGGSRVDVQHFIEMLENLPYVSVVTAVDLSARSTTVWSAAVTMQIKLVPYD